MLSPFSYVRPESMDETLKHLQAGKARIHAGGTDLLSCLRDHVFDADLVVSLSGLNGLQGVRQSADGGLSIGALATIYEIAHNPLIEKQYKALSRAASEVASPQLRKQGTLGGNLCQKPRCWYYRGEFHCLRKGGNECFAVGGENAFHCIFGGENCYIVHPSDTAPALSALDARVRTRGPQGERLIPVDQFFVLPKDDYARETVLEPGEIVTEILLPAAPATLKSSYRKVRGRRSWDFALAGVALAIEMKGEIVSRARIFLSGAAPIPWRSREAEETITGKKLDFTTIRQAAEAAVRQAEPMEQNAYKVPLFQQVIAEELQAIGSRQ
jgi:xanthine dehydrogenase YagS FAD-binding subunit